jgi:hypothetical protein
MHQAGQGVDILAVDLDQLEGIVGRSGLTFWHGKP